MFGKRRTIDATMALASDASDEIMWLRTSKEFDHMAERAERRPRSTRTTAGKPVAAGKLGKRKLSRENICEQPEVDT